MQTTPIYNLQLARTQFPTFDYVTAISFFFFSLTRYFPRLIGVTCAVLVNLWWRTRSRLQFLSSTQGKVETPGSTSKVVTMTIMAHSDARWLSDESNGSFRVASCVVVKTNPREKPFLRTFISIHVHFRANQTYLHTKLFSNKGKKI